MLEWYERRRGEDDLYERELCEFEFSYIRMSGVRLGCVSLGGRSYSID